MSCGNKIVSKLFKLFQPTHLLANRPSQFSFYSRSSTELVSNFASLLPKLVKYCIFKFGLISQLYLKYPTVTGVFLPQLTTPMVKYPYNDCPNLHCSAPIAYFVRSLTLLIAHSTIQLTNHTQVTALFSSCYTCLL